MAYAHIVDILAVGGINGGTTAGVDTTGANLIVLVVTSFGAVGEPTVSDSKSNAWTGLTAYNNTTNQGRVRIYYCYAPTVGSGHTFTVSGSGTYSAVGGAAFSGSTSSPFDQQNGAFNISVSTIQPGSITPTENNELIISATSYNDAGTSSINSGFTEATELNPVGAQNFGTVLSYLIQTTAAAVNPTITTTAAAYRTTCIASFKAAAGGGSVEEADITLAISQQLGLAGGAVASRDVTLATSEAVTLAAVEDAARSLGLATSLAGAFSCLHDAAASASMAISQACDADGVNAIDVAVELSHQEAADFAALNQAEGGVSLAGALATVILTDALALAGVSLSSVLNMAIIGAESGAVIITPRCRTVRVKVSVRSVEVPVQRVVVKRDDRRSDAGCCG